MPSAAPRSCRSVLLLPLLAVSAASSLASLLGCGTHASTSAVSAGSTTQRGLVTGGQQPVAGATIQLFAVGTTGDASAATPLLTVPVVTQADGSFNFLPANYTCPTPTTPVYLAATGGNPGLAAGTSNGALALMAALGACGNLTASTRISVDELTTVAAAYALAPFAASPTSIGSAAADASVLNSAFTLASQYSNVTTGTVPGAALPAGAADPTTELDTLADILAGCINSPGGVAGDGSPCGTLFALTTAPGGASPTDTVTAAVTLARNPTLNTSALFALATATSPYQPTLAAAPADLSINLTPAAALTVSADALVFPTTYLGDIAPTMPVSVADTGTAAMSFSSPVFVGVNASDFAVSNDCGTNALAAGGRCSFSINFQPTGVGPREATLQITSGGVLHTVPVTGTGLAVAAQAAVPQPLADYTFLDGSGTSVSDRINGLNGTLGTGAQAPTWVAGGLQFATTENVSLPAALNAAQSVVLAVYINPLTAAQPDPPNYSVLLTNSLGTAGLNLLTQANSVSGYYLRSTFSPSILANGNGATFGTKVLSGFHVFTYTFGTAGTAIARDHIYVDGVELPGYLQQGASAGLQSSGNFFFGASPAQPWAEAGLQGTFYRAQFFTSPLSAAQAAAASLAVLREVTDRGIVTTPLPAALTTPQLHCIGDSITYGQGVSTPFCSELSLAGQPAYTVTNWGIPNIELSAIAGSEPNRVELQCQSTGGPAVAMVFAGTNDFYSSFSPASQVEIYLKTEIAALKAGGCQVYVGTMLSRSGTDQAGVTTLDSDKNTYDTDIRANAVSWGADGVVDFAANPLLGADSASTDSTYFQADGTHPTVLGQALLASAASNTLNFYGGSTAAAPHTVGALPYAMASGDRYLTLAGLSGSGTVTLPDCTGPTGGIYTVNNAQGTATVAIAPLNAAQPVDGSMAAVTLPSNTSATFTVVANAAAVGGCHWQR